jgi:hypothetical protein
MADNLHKNILATVVYYDVMDYPLTSFEVWKYLIANNAANGQANERECSLAEVMDKLESEETQKYIEEYQGFYFLKNRKNLVGQRLERNKISETKYKIILRAARFLKFIPHIRMIAATGRVAMKNAEEKSDLDVLIVFEKGHIFTGRFLTFALLNIMGIRRNDKKIKNRICLNNFLSTAFSVSTKDLFSSHAYVFMLPVFGFESYKKFIENNIWIKNCRPNFKNEVPPVEEIKDSDFAKIIRKILEKIFSFEFIERSLKKIQIAKIEANPKTQKKGGVIIYSDDELAFWPDFEKQGPAIYENFKNKLAALDIKQEYLSCLTN